MEIRRATAVDAPQVMTLAFEQYMEELSYLVGLNFSFMTCFTSFIRETQSPDIGHTLVAEEEGKIVGIYSCLYAPSNADNAQKICREAGWYVRPEHRKKGIGRAFLKASEKLAAEHGCHFNQVGTAVTTEEGRTLLEWYKREGYIPFQLQSFKRITPEDMTK